MILVFDTVVLLQLFKFCVVTSNPHLRRKFALLAGNRKPLSDTIEVSNRFNPGTFNNITMGYHQPAISNVIGQDCKQDCLLLIGHKYCKTLGNTGGDVDSVSHFFNADFVRHLIKIVQHFFSASSLLHGYFSLPFRRCFPLSRLPSLYNIKWQMSSVLKNFFKNFSN